MDAVRAREQMKTEKEKKYERELWLRELAKEELEGFFIKRNYRNKLKKLERLVEKAVRVGEEQVQYDGFGVSTDRNWILTYKLENHFTDLGYEFSSIEYEYGNTEYISIMVYW